MTGRPREGRALAAASALLALATVQLFSENLSLRTALPSPVAMYRRLTASGPSVLARDGGTVLLNPAANGTVAVGTPTPLNSLRLDVRGRTGFAGGDLAVSAGGVTVQGGVLRADGGLRVECLRPGAPRPTQAGRMWVESPAC